MSVPCFAETEDEVVSEALIGQRIAQYNIELNAPFTKETSGIGETVNSETGAVTYTISLFPINARTFEDTITLSYNTYNAKLKQESYYFNGAAFHNKNESFSNLEVTNEGFAVGWRFDLPYVEKVGSKSYVHLPDGAVYLYDEQEETGLKDYELTDVKFVLTDDSCSLTYLNGGCFEFDTDGLLVTKSDRNGNFINYIWDKTATPYTLKTIVSCTGKSIMFSYNADSVVVSNGEKQIVIERKKQSEGDKIPFLKSITDPENRKTEFFYGTKALDYTLVGETEFKSNNYYPIERIIYDTGLETHYQYEVSKKNSGSGYLSYLKLSKRYDKATNGMVSNTQAYAYFGEPDGYPSYDPDELPADYTYATTVYNQDGSKDVFVYNNKHDTLSKTQYVNDIKQSETFYSYDSITRSPTKTISKVFGNDSYRTVYTDTEYNDRGELLSSDTYDDTAGKGKFNTEYAYSSKYGIEIYQKQKKDSNNTIETKSVLDGSGKFVESTTVYHNGVPVKTTYYKYDSYGNTVSIKEQTSSNTFRTQEFVYSGKTAFSYPDKYIIRGVENINGNAGDIIVSYEYDDFGNVLSSTDGEGNVTRYEYDKLSNVVSETLPNGGKRTNDYNYRKNIIKTTDALGNSLTYYYDNFGRLTSVIDNQTGGNLTTKVYNAKGLLESETDAIGTKFTYTYDNLNRVVAISASDKDGNAVSVNEFSYDEAYLTDGSAYSRFETKATGNAGTMKTVYLFDFLGRQYSVENVGENDSRISRYEYDYLGNNTSIVLPDGSVQTSEYDIFGNMLSNTYGGITEKITYDLVGNQLSATNGEGETTYTYYNALGLAIKTKSPYTDLIKYSIAHTYYDACGRVTKQVDGEGNVTEYAYDANGNLVKAVMGDSVTTYEYDAENRMTAMHTGSEGNKHTQTFEYDHFGNVLRTTDELGFVEEYTYDPNGNALTYIDKNGTVVYNTYDGLNRVLNTRNSKDNTSFAYTYDGAGQLIKVNDTEYSYNLYGELVKQTENGISQNYSYNSLGNRASYSLANGDITEMQIAYGYDKAARLSKVSSILGDQLYTYDDANRLLKSVNSVSGIGSEYSYFPSGNIKSLTQYNGSKTTDSIRYEYNRNGFRTVEQGINSAKVYTYDNQNRLHEAFDGELLSVYNYDDFGNIKTIKSFAGTVGSVTNYTYDRNNRLTSRFVDGIKTEYAYDRQGNLIAEKDEVGSTAYHYNGFNRLTGVYGDNLDATYTYDHTGLRTSKNVNGVYTRLVNDGQNVVAQYVDGRASCFYRGSSLIGYTNSQNEVNFYQFNAHGDVVSILDCFGNTVRSYDYDAFGKQKDVGDSFYRNQYGSAVDDNPFRYCGEYFDDETGLIYLRARYYNPDVQRFVAQDTHWTPENMIYGDIPVELSLNFDESVELINKKTVLPVYSTIVQSNNGFVYCGNNPVEHTDSSGENWKDTVYGIAQAIDDNHFGGLVGWAAKKLGGGKRSVISKYDYYLGRVIGDAISMIYGAGVSASGICKILSSIITGGAVSIGSGGTLAIGGISISVAGVATGTATATYGGTVVMLSAKNFGNDFKKMQSESNKIAVSKKNLKSLDDKFLKNNNIDPHSFKKDILKSANVKDKTISHYDIMRHPSTKELFLVPKGNNVAISTGVILD